MAVDPVAGNRAELYIGLMSGTSLDGVDAVLADCSLPTPRVLAHAYRPFPKDVRAELLALTSPGPDEIERSGAAALGLVDVYAHCVADLLQLAACTPADICAIGAHGQTIRHRPEAGYSLQLNAPARLAELTRIDVVADFRSRDLAAGGQGAPLVPAFHAAAFSAAAPRAVVNIGGVSNVSYLPDGEKDLLGFDCGPGNLLLDAWASDHRAEPFDRNGEFAATGRLDQELLTRLLAEPFLDLAPPKSTGRELFSQTWLDKALSGTTRRPEDVQRTLTEFTARCIGDAIKRWCASARDVVVCGGGARNATLMAALASAVEPRPLLASSALGIPPDQVEALAFAWLARRCQRRETGSIPAVTGARGARILGAIYPR
ncbi:MAG TPA: anhydro-N-acetylmuramic acid kinase [Burkholderiaceae bacterium]|nr:anhydro-N-acetylmuramic acid kinase [Burkholderiaceae bacterium]